jgi:hypothetical protein
MTDVKATGITEFRAAVEAHFLTLAADYDLEPRCVDERLVALVGESICVKIYLPECHGYDITVTFAPNYNPIWNAEDELGLRQLKQYLELDEAPLSRRTNPSELDELASTLAARSRDVLANVLPASTEFWQGFRSWWKKHIAEQSR